MIVPLESYHLKVDLEKAYTEMFAELRKHAIEVKYVQGNRVHLRIKVDISEMKAKEVLGEDIV